MEGRDNDESARNVRRLDDGVCVSDRGHLWRIARGGGQVSRFCWGVWHGEGDGLGPARYYQRLCGGHGCERELHLPDPEQSYEGRGRCSALEEGLVGYRRPIASEPKTYRAQSGGLSRCGFGDGTVYACNVSCFVSGDAREEKLTETLGTMLSSSSRKRRPITRRPWSASPFSGAQL